MKKIFLSFIFLILFNFSAAYAQTTDESSISNLLLKNYKIASENDVQNMFLVIDYSIEILKKTPNSLASYYTVGCVVSACFYRSRDEIKLKFKELYDKYFSSLNDITSDTIEKILLSEILFLGYSVKGTTDEEIENSHQIGKTALQNIKDNCVDKDYAALAAMFLLTGLSHNEIVEPCKNFIETYPTHRAIPLIEAKMVMETYFFSIETRDYIKFIEENKKLIDKYKEINSPFGSYKLVIDNYAFIVRAYLRLGDLDEAKKYLELVKKEAPDYYELKEIQSEVENYTETNHLRTR